MALKNLKSINLKGKTILLRCDLNSPFINKKLHFSERIKQSALTIKQLKKRKAKIVIISHQGRPGAKDFTSLKQHAKLLSKITKVKFVSDTIGKKAQKEIKNLKQGQAILLENLRKSKFEFQHQINKQTKILSSLCDIYVNDAFSVSHRNQNSIVASPRLMPSYMGFLFEKELNALAKAKSKNTLYVLGGAKPEDNVKLLKTKNKILPAGLFAPLCAISQGKNLGKQNQLLKNELKLVSEIKKHKTKIIFPRDFAVLVKGKRKNLALDEFPSKYPILDLGDKTIFIYKKQISKASSIYMKGPAGVYSKKGFEKGTLKLLKAVSNSKAHSVIGGGHLSDALNKFKINKNRFDYVSLSGGASLRFLSGEKLPGLEALKKSKK